MGEFSARTKSPSLAKLLALAEVLQSIDPELRRETYVKRRYEDLTTDFELSLDYFKLLGFVVVKDGIINLLPELRKIIEKGELNSQHFKNAVVNNLLSEKISSDYLNEFYNLFKKTDGSMVLKLSLDERLKYSDLRNLFVELGTIKYLPSTDLYKVDSLQIQKFQNASERTRRSMSEEQLLKQLENQKTLGTDAELLIIEYEHRRLSAEPSLASKVGHTAKSDVGAGYDILSWELHNKEKRYIEVKAVSPDNFQFYWSKNEIDTALRLGKRYFLYLVPVNSGKFNLSSMEIVQDPHKNVFRDKKHWSKAEKIYTIWKDQQ
jgi:hypothetical protein